jgi:hypothetical protein
MTVLARIFATAFAIAALLGAGAWGYAQGAASPQRPFPPVISGPDIGFEMVGRRKGKPVGRLVVRIDGEWKEVEFAHTLTPVQ